MTYTHENVIKKPVLYNSYARINTTEMPTTNRVQVLGTQLGWQSVLLECKKLWVQSQYFISGRGEG